MSRVYKLMSRADWAQAQAAGRFDGSAVDRADGYIHFSTGDQVAETARRHFAGHADLMLVIVETEALTQPLRWEPSRGGALFPHLYGALPLSAVVEARAAPLQADGLHALGPLG